MGELVGRSSSGKGGENVNVNVGGNKRKERCGGYFQMPVHYPRYTKADYESMPEWKLDCLLSQYGLPVIGDVHHKRNFAMGAFLWPQPH